MAASPAISIGDLIKAVVGLEARDAAMVDRIAVLLGLRFADPPSASTATLSQGTSPTGDGEEIPEPVDLHDHDVEEQRAPQARASPRARHDRDLPSRAADLERLDDDSVMRRPPRETPPLDQLLSAPAIDAAVADTSLFVSGWQRGILTALISTASLDGPIDIPRLVEAIANGLAVQHLPRQATHTTRKGLHVLIDLADGMGLFVEDVAAIERLLRTTAGEDGVDVMRFECAPLAGAGRGTRRTWKPYALPPAGTPILVLSDFGMASPLGESMELQLAWQAVSTLAAQKGCPLLALTPFPASRWPDWLTQVLSPVQWDRPTNAASARRAAQQAARK